MGIGVELVRELLSKSERYGLEIVILTYDPKHKNFYETCGFTPVQVGYGINRNELGALPHYQRLLYYRNYCNERK